MGNLEENSYLEIAEFKDRIEVLANTGKGELDEQKVNSSVKLISKIIKKADRKKKKILIVTNLNLDKEEKKDNKKWTMIASLNACKITDKVERLEYIYMAACKYLDNEFRNKNICEFSNDMCIGKKGTNVKNGCCHEMNILKFQKELPLCRFQKNRTCTADCLGCKLFACDAVNKKGIKYTCFNVALIKYFFNIWQKIIIKATVFAPKEKVLKRLKIFNNL